MTTQFPDINCCIPDRYSNGFRVRKFPLQGELPIKQLVYANVMMMDEYLPGIRSVIEGDVEPKDAIASILILRRTALK
jgi:hypothetical protein